MGAAPRFLFGSEITASYRKIVDQISCAVLSLPTFLKAYLSGPTQASHDQTL